VKFVSSKELRNNPAQLWKFIENEEVVITVNGKPMAIVVGAENDIEEQLKIMRRSRAKVALEKLRSYSVQQGFDKLTEDDIDREIKKIRTKV
ncbi:MAG: type II toxin-antitoxin system prevent-host-death family antitoxin, partial [Candidatus Atribacteria bacterium]|nr:type II toxin-antitoxin system prevent-host-death family antitoxin [Candidatus Atribacteria bacterium]